MCRSPNTMAYNPDTMSFEEPSTDMVYVSGLPSNTTEEDIAAHFGSIGLLKEDKKKNKPKIWLYRDKGTNQLKVCYALAFPMNDHALQPLSDQGWMQTVSSMCVWLWSLCQQRECEAASIAEISADNLVGCRGMAQSHTKTHSQQLQQCNGSTAKSSKVTIQPKLYVYVCSACCNVLAILSSCHI